MTALRVTGLLHGSIDLAESGEFVSMASILDRLMVNPAATHCTVVSSDGSYSASIPVDELRSGGLLSLVPPDAGGPVRLRVTEGSTLCWNVKDVGELRFTAGREPDSIPANPVH